MLFKVCCRSASTRYLVAFRVCNKINDSLHFIILELNYYLHIIFKRILHTLKFEDNGIETNKISTEIFI